MKPSIVFATLVVSAILVSAARASLDQEWEKFKQDHGRSYGSTAEEARRRSLFEAAYAAVEDHNGKSNMSYTMGVNKFADWTPAEFKQMGASRLGPLDQVTKVYSEAELSEFVDLGRIQPKSVDLRRSSRVTAVKDQRDCGSGWAFAATGLIEAHQQQRVNFAVAPVPMSEQQFVDCSESNSGCNGGRVDMALRDLNATDLYSEADYPYTARQAVCCQKLRGKKPVLHFTGAISKLAPANERLMKKMLASHGPIAVTLEASKRFARYKSGVYVDDNGPRMFNQAVLVVGYGKDLLEGKYWIVKNSWGANWGEKGYMRIKRGTNACSIASEPLILRTW